MVSQVDVLNRQRKRRVFRVRKKLRGTAERPRLSVHRTLKHIYCQLIDDETGKTLVSASSRDRGLRSNKYAGNVETASSIGKALAERALAEGIQKACFDRGRNQYHGRVKAVAEAAREAGLEL